ncbi:kinase-related protein [Moniliophthora roreri]|uniref:Phosphoribulokinase/uridine kinase domain-containing protein n=1 Tax=Moniliophthora roreri TaxID=221103 RepID=A0A0W0F2F6_MONRR|nr:kinase-related protein [Moniliophthora roreri]
MDGKSKELARALVDLLAQKPASSRLLVGLCGIPASGKTSFADILLRDTNQLLESSTTQVAVVGLDGWHLTRAQLEQFPDPKLAHDRRGIHWTFDGPAYLDFVRALRKEINPSTQIITAPSFDHATKDPTPDAISIHPYHRIVIIEGLYTTLDVDSWGDAARLLDERWYIELSIEEAQRRLIKRHVVSGVAQDEKEAIWRAEENDMPNGRFVIANMLKPTRVIESIDDPTFSS